MKKYTFEVVVYEGNDEFWEDIQYKTGCDEVLQMVKDTLGGVGLVDGNNCSVELRHYSNEE